MNGMVNPEGKTLSAGDLCELLGYGIRLHQQGDLPSAAECYQKILMQQPNYPEALNFYGVLTHQQGNSATGLELIGKAIQLAPDYFDAYANAGRILMELERFQRAEECYAKAVELRPDSLNAQRGLSSARQQVQYSRERLVICKEELEAHSDDPSAHYQYGLECRGQNQLELAEQAFLRAIELDPQAREAYYQLSRVYYGQDNEAKMLQTLKKWLDNLPGDPSVQYMYLAMTGENTPARASDEYVQESFDKFAASFDQVLQSVDYRAPGLIGQAVAQLALETGQFHQALDAGCGTGLCGPLLRPHVSRLSGVDLSQKMLDKSISRASYDELVQGELTAFIAAHEAYYDLIVSADTLVYFGDLKPVMEAAYKALLPGGGLIFTVEKLDGPGTRQYQLNPHGRYSHSTDYVAEILAGVGFDIRFIAVAVLRFEGGKSVPGLLVSAGKPGFSAGA